MVSVKGLLSDIASQIEALTKEVKAIRAEQAEFKGSLQANAQEHAEFRAALEANSREHAEFRAALEANSRELRKLGLEFESFRHDSKIALENISGLMVRTSKNEKAIASLNRRTRRVESHLALRPLPNHSGEG